MPAFNMAEVALGNNHPSPTIGTVDNAATLRRFRYLNDCGDIQGTVAAGAFLTGQHARVLPTQGQYLPERCGYTLDNGLIPWCGSQRVLS